MLEPYFILINHIRLECWYNGHSSPLRLINKSFIEMHGRLLEDLAAVFCWYALLPHASPISIPFLRIHFWSIWLHCMREARLTHTHTEKAAGYETHLCTLRTSSLQVWHQTSSLASLDRAQTQPSIQGVQS